MRRRAYIGTAAVALLGAAPAWALWPHIHPELKDGRVTVRSVVVLPARVELVRVGLHGAESMEEVSQQLAATLYRLVTAELAARGVKVAPNPADPAPADALKYAIADLQMKYDNVGVQLRKNLDGVEKCKYTLGDRVAAFDPARGTDAIVFIRARGRNYNKAFWATGPLTTLVAGQFQTDIGVVDAKSGNVLAFLRTVLFKVPFPTQASRH